MGALVPACGVSSPHNGDCVLCRACTENDIVSANDDVDTMQCRLCLKRWHVLCHQSLVGSKVAEDYPFTCASCSEHIDRAFDGSLDCFGDIDVGEESLKGLEPSSSSSGSKRRRCTLRLIRLAITT